MELSVNARYFMKTLPDEAKRTPYECMKLFYDAGFRYLDYTPYTAGEDWEEQTDIAIEAAARCGMILEQSHAPYNRYSKRPIEEYRRHIDRSLEAAARMGNKQIAVHADDYAMEADGSYNGAHAMEQMYDFWAPFADKAAKLGVNLAIETVFEDRRGVPMSRFTSRLDELMGFIDRFHAPHVVCCWDSGHAYIAFKSGMLDAMKTLGSRITCTHIHDNYYATDLHLLPYEGEIPWEDHMKTLKTIGYKGNLTYEFVYGCRPACLLEDFAATAYKTGMHLKSIFDKA